MHKSIPIKKSLKSLEWATTQPTCSIYVNLSYPNKITANMSCLYKAF